MAGGIALSVPSTALCLSPEEVFRKAAQSVVTIEVLDKSLRSFAFGSGVIVDDQQVVTNCHVIAEGSGIRVLKDGRRFIGSRTYSDPERDLCLLEVNGLPGRKADFSSRRTITPGTRVFAIGSPRGLELSISEGLVSGLREFKDSYLIQTSAPISKGSSGGGLFNDNGELEGITTSGMRDGQNLNFALPAFLIVELRRRALVSSTPQQTDNQVSAREKQQKEATSDIAVPSLRFANPTDGYRWLAEMSERLKVRIPDPQIRIELLKTVHYEATRANLDPQLILGVIQAVSGFKKFAVSSAGARGYMQVMPSWINVIGEPGHNLFHLRVNLRYGCVILRHYLDIEKGDLYRALNRYNGTPAGESEFPNLVMAALRTWKYDGRLY
ncbi:MAG: trypsin-like peptidase domain-containing protein [Burkholderiales bacterium]